MMARAFPRPSPRCVRRRRSCCDRQPTTTRTTVKGRAYLDLQNLARRQQRPADELHQLYALEGLLARLVGSLPADPVRVGQGGGKRKRVAQPRQHHIPVGGQVARRRRRFRATGRQRLAALCRQVPDQHRQPDVEEATGRYCPLSPFRAHATIMKAIPLTTSPDAWCSAAARR